MPSGVGLEVIKHAFGGGRPSENATDSYSDLALEAESNLERKKNVLQLLRTTHTGRIP